MQELVLKSIGLGAILSIFIGPVFFLLLETSFQQGFLPALWVSLGALISDLFFIAISLLIVKGLLAFNIDHHILRLAGGLVFSGFGIYYIFRNPHENKTKNLFENYLMLKSFVLNSINPSILFFWLGAVAYGATLFSNRTPHIVTYLVIAIGTTFILDVVKIYLSTRIRKAISPKIISNIHKITGIALLLFGTTLIFQSITNLN